MLAALPSLSEAQPGDFAELRGGAVLATLVTFTGPVPFQVFTGLLGIWLACMGAASIWRLATRAPALIVDPDGIRFHPSLHIGFVRWSDIRRIEIGNRPSGLCVRVRRRFWSLASPGTSRTVEIKLVAAGLAYRDARRLVVGVRKKVREAASIA
jgi:hypothetical protein